MNAAGYASLLRHDVRLQWRYGIYAAYGVVLAMYVALLAWGGERLPAWMAGVLIFTDPAALGFFFLGALMMLERSEDVRTALAVSPLRPGEYLASKMVTLTIMVLIACGVLSVAAKSDGRHGLLLFSIALTSIQYIGIGVPIALRFKTVSAYLVGSASFLTPLIAPGFLALLDPLPAWMQAIPAVAQLKLILVATGAATASPTAIATMLLVSAGAAAGATFIALRALREEFGRP